MAQIAVTPEAVAAQGSKLASLSGDLSGGRGWLSVTQDAAGGTPAAGACARMCSQWLAGLGAMGQMTDGLAAAVRQAAVCYEIADQTAMPEPGAH